jgi:hypothetical protein
VDLFELVREEIVKGVVFELLGGGRVWEQPVLHFRIGARHQCSAASSQCSLDSSQEAGRFLEPRQVLDQGEVEGAVADAQAAFGQRCIAEAARCIARRGFGGTGRVGVIDLDDSSASFQQQISQGRRRIAKDDHTAPVHQ